MNRTLLPGLGNQGRPRRRRKKHHREDSNLSQRPSQNRVPPWNGGIVETIYRARSSVWMTGIAPVTSWLSPTRSAAELHPGEHGATERIRTPTIEIRSLVSHPWVGGDRGTARTRRGGGTRTQRSFAPSERTGAVLPRRSSPHPRHRVGAGGSRWNRTIARTDMSRRGAQHRLPSRARGRSGIGDGSRTRILRWRDGGISRYTTPTRAGLAGASREASVTGVEPVFPVGKTGVFGPYTTRT